LVEEDDQLRRDLFAIRELFHQRVAH
jgi:hypothetical protein